MTDADQAFLGRLFYCYNVCYTFSTACHGNIEFVETAPAKIRTYIATIQKNWGNTQDFQRKHNFFQQRFAVRNNGKSLFAARLRSHRRKTKQSIRFSGTQWYLRGWHSQQKIYARRSAPHDCEPLSGFGCYGAGIYHFTERCVTVCREKTELKIYYIYFLLFEKLTHGGTHSFYL